MYYFNANVIPFMMYIFIHKHKEHTHTIKHILSLFLQTGLSLAFGCQWKTKESIIITLYNLLYSSKLPTAIKLFFKNTVCRYFAFICHLNYFFDRNIILSMFWGLPTSLAISRDLMHICSMSFPPLDIVLPPVVDTGPLR